MKLDIITPVGPGHEQLVHRAAHSINIAKEHSMGPFDEIDLIAVDDTKGEMGRSQARNVAVEDSDADWIFFLDADDLMHAMAFAYFDAYTGRDAVWGKIVEYKEGNLLERYQVPEILNLGQLLSHDPYLTLQMGHFVKAEIAKSTPFNEGMNTGEDWDYYLRLWMSDYDCIKADVPFMCNSRGEHSTGPRSANGQQWREAVEKLIEAAR